MRIIGGSARGRRLRAPRGREARPTQDRVREALFSLLGERCLETRVLDLFAGTGALGLEALSRGAAAALFVEQAPRCLEVLQANLDACGFNGRAVVRRGDAQRVLTRLAREDEQFDLVFLDPPYGQDLDRAALKDLLRHRLLAPRATVVVETAAQAADPAADLDEVLEPLQQRSYGDTMLWLYQAEGSSDCE